MLAVVGQPTSVHPAPLDFSGYRRHCHRDCRHMVVEQGKCLRKTMKPFMFLFTASASRKSVRRTKELNGGLGKVQVKRLPKRPCEKSTCAAHTAAFAGSKGTERSPRLGPCRTSCGIGHLVTAPRRVRPVRPVEKVNPQVPKLLCICYTSGVNTPTVLSVLERGSTLGPKIEVL